MIRRSVLASAWLLDWIAGDPEWLPHPVRLMGAAITGGERLLLRPTGSDTHKLVAGGALSVTLVAATYAVTRTILTLARHRGLVAGSAAEILLAWTCLASRSLHDEASAVLRALQNADLPLARQKLARVVGRDTLLLDEADISRALIETLAESSCDGVVAPLFYLALGGVPLGMAFKAVSTLDSMIGHTSERYLYFGRVAARLDDAANYIPARLTALLITAAAGSRARMAAAARIWFRDGARHKSPNAGRPEAAMAGALTVRLGGASTYNGERVETPLLGAEFQQPSAAQAARALRLAFMVSMVSMISVVSLLGFLTIPGLAPRLRRLPGGAR